MDAFALSNLKWGDAARGKTGGVVNWSFAARDRTLDPSVGSHMTSYESFITDEAFRQLVRDAFQSWENVADIDFVEVADGMSTQLLLGYDSIDGGPQPGKSNILADAQTFGASSQPGATLFSIQFAIVRFDIAEAWTAVKTAVGGFFSTAVHEIGHAIGLLHSGDAGTIMSAFAGIITDVAAGDVAGVQALYGAAKSEPDPITVAPFFASNADTAKGLALAYETLLDGVPNQAGFEFLINSAVSTNFGAGSGVEFNVENIFINLVNNLVQGNTEAKARFDGLATGNTLEEKVTSFYNSLIPASKQTAEGLAFIIRPEGLQFYQDVAAERGVAGTDGAAIVSLASLLKIAVTGDYGVGNAVNDLIKAVAAGSAAIPATGTTLTPLETADGTAFDADDAVTMARIAVPATSSEVYASPSDVSEVAFASSVSTIGYADGHDGGWAG